jgi:hypothetical protein
MEKLGLDDFLNSVKPGTGGQRMSTFRDGNTLFYVVKDESGHADFVGVTQTQWGEDAPRPAFVFYAVILKADDSSKLVEGWKNSAVPVRVPKTLISALGGLLQDNEYTDAAQLSVLDPDTGDFTPGSLFVVNRYKDGKGFTSYEAKVVTKVSKALKGATPGQVVAPEIDIAATAAEHTAWQEKMTAQRGNEAPVVEDNDEDDDLF